MFYQVKHRRNLNIMIGSMEIMVSQYFPDMSIESYESLRYPEVYTHELGVKF